MDQHGEHFVAGRKLALVCHNGSLEQEMLKSALEEIGYNVVCARTADEVLSTMLISKYEVIVLDETFDGSMRENNTILKAIQNMLMAIRRSLFVVLVGNQFVTGDHMMAFSQSVNIVIHPNDVGTTSTILTHAIAEDKEFFRTLTECFHEAGIVT
tara:strand:+ start:3274 stop:3738 length:465 start_codon:yes stop_codon:yes gene_type:complete